MMRALLNLTALLLLAAVVSPGLSLGQSIESDRPAPDEESEIDDDMPVQKVARLPFVQGDVSFLRAGVTEWAPAVENLPLLAGDQIYCGTGARAEIQRARGNYIRLSEGTELTISVLNDSAAQFEITEGTALIRAERLSSAFGRFEVDTPNSAIILQQDGLYRFDAHGEQKSELIVREGEATVSTDDGNFRVQAGHKLLLDTSSNERMELALDSTRDEWDQWSHDRDDSIDRTLTGIAPNYVASYETTYNDFYGADDLSSYGTWTTYGDYGQCWVPRVSSDWAPYRFGQWIWVPVAGWTWLSSERWGWAPYHYGRWAFVSGLGWVWVPGFRSYRGVYAHRYYRWRPALVQFSNISTSSGDYVCWNPLRPGERWRRNWHRDDGRGRDGWRRPDP